MIHFSFRSARNSLLSNDQLLPKKRSRVSTRTEEFEYEPSTRRGRTRRATKKLTESVIVPPPTDDSANAYAAYKCPICGERFSYDYGLLLHVDCHPASLCTCLYCSQTFGSAYGLVMHHMKSSDSKSSNHIFIGIKFHEDQIIIL